MSRRSPMGSTRTPEYVPWRSMIQRCENESCPSFADYGARGISVCPRWRNSFAAFREDIGPRPSRAHSIERIDNNGNYEPGNVRWATRNEQARNKRNNRIVEYQGERVCVAAAAEKVGLTASTLHRRLTDGWPVDIALTVPAHGQRPTASLGGRRTKTEAAKDRSRSPLGRSQRLAALALARAALAAAGPRGEKLSRDAAEHIRARLSNGEVGAVIAREYGVTNNVISRIKRGLIWRVQ